jgi:hypothetical protein
MGNFSATGKEFLLAAVQDVWTSLHSADPGPAGANELSGGDPAYARRLLALTSPAGGVLPATENPVFDVPGGARVAAAGFWTKDALGAWVFLGGHIILNNQFEPAVETYAAQGFYTLINPQLSLEDQT